MDGYGTAIILAIWLITSRIFTKKEDLRRMEAEEIQETRRDGNVPG